MNTNAPFTSRVLRNLNRRMIFDHSYNTYIYYINIYIIYLKIVQDTRELWKSADFDTSNSAMPLCQASTASARWLPLQKPSAGSQGKLRWTESAWCFPPRCSMMLLYPLRIYDFYIFLWHGEVENHRVLRGNPPVWTQHVLSINHPWAVQTPNALTGW